jgi:hypothetical protein
MSAWEIDWRAEEWSIWHRPTHDLVIYARYDGRFAGPLVEQEPIRVHRGRDRAVCHPWPWPYPESPAPDTVIAELRRIAAEYLGGNPE